MLNMRTSHWESSACFGFAWRNLLGKTARVPVGAAEEPASFGVVQNVVSCGRTPSTLHPREGSRCDCLSPPRLKSARSGEDSHRVGSQSFLEKGEIFPTTANPVYLFFLEIQYVLQRVRRLGKRQMCHCCRMRCEIPLRVLPGCLQAWLGPVLAWGWPMLMWSEPSVPFIWATPHMGFCSAKDKQGERHRPSIRDPEVRRGLGCASDTTVDAFMAIHQGTRIPAHHDTQPMCGGRARRARNTLIKHVDWTCHEERQGPGPSRLSRKRWLWR